jgi:hypothetical protein
MATNHSAVVIGSASTVPRKAMQLVWTNCVDSLTSIDGERRNRRGNALRHSPQVLFEALDGTVIRVDGNEWHLEVFSVLMEAGLAWLQVLLSGEPSYTLTLKLPGHKGVAHVISIITSWLANPAESSQVLNVA